jgi:hypothetical protein
MTFHAIGIVAAFFAQFVFGFVYYSEKVAFTAWWKAMGNEGKHPGDGGSMPLLFGLTALGGLASVVLTAALFSLIGGDLSLGAGLGYGAFAGLIAVSISLSHRLFAGHGLKVWGLETIGDVSTYAIIGAVLSFWY